jgi:AcrR family transcriptional regulator
MAPHLALTLSLSYLKKHGRGDPSRWWGIVLPRNRRSIPRDERECEILDAAKQEFAELGYARATMDGIARRAQMTTPNVYHYFSGKDELFLAVGEREMEKLLLGLEELRDEAPVAQLNYVIRYHRDRQELRDDYETQALHNPAIRRLTARRNRLIRALTEAAVDDLALPPSERALGVAAVQALATSLIMAGAGRTSPARVLEFVLSKLAAGGGEGAGLRDAVAVSTAQKPSAASPKKPLAKAPRAGSSRLRTRR